MPANLSQILDSTQRRVEAARSSADIAQLRERANAHTPRGFRLALEKSSRKRAAVIAELKKASPSKGLLRADFSVAALAAELEKSGASALSVLTEPEFFQGSLQNLSIASSATRLPCLRKDFIVDEFQLLEARAHKADAVLLIAAALSPQQLTALAASAHQLSLDVLCEVHDERELELAVAAGCDVIGVNSRDLRTFQVDHATLLRLAPLLPKNVLAVAESGLNLGSEMRELAAAGYRAFLIGESLMRAELPGEKLRRLLEEFKAGG